MPVYKFRTFDEAKKSQWVFNTDDSYFNKVKELFEIAHHLNPIKYPKGIFYYKTLEQANEQRFYWEVEHALRKQNKIIKNNGSN